MKSADTLTLALHKPASLLTRLAVPLLRRHAKTNTASRQRERNADGIDDSDSGEFTLFEAGRNDRAQIEAFIHHNYAKNFGARIEAFMPRLFGLRDSNGTLCGAFGLRTTSGKLFLEQYLQSAIESEIGARCGRAIARAGIVEVGHFSGAFPGAARAMIYLLTLRLRAENFAWVSFTGTRALRNAFQRMGLHLIDIAAADCTQLPESARAHWGTYYDNAPRVMAGEIDSGYALLAPNASDDTERCA